MQDCQERNSSTEFLRWNEFLDNRDWHENSKLDHGLARIAYEIRCAMKMFGDKREIPELDEFIPTFVRRDGSTSKKNENVSTISKSIEGGNDFDTGWGQPGIELDDKPELDLKWQVINAQAKAEWGMLPGITVISTG